MVKNQKKKVKKTATKKVKKAPVKQITKSADIPQKSATKSRKGLIFKIAIWILTILFFLSGLIFAAVLANQNCENPNQFVLDMGNRFFEYNPYVVLIYAIAMMIYSIILFSRLKKNIGIIVLFLLYLLSIILFVITIMNIKRRGDDIMAFICVAIFALIPIVFSIKAKKFLWYLFYLCWGISYFVLSLIVANSFSNCPQKYDQGGNAIGKPIIYLYPEQKTDVSVKVGYPEKFTHTYPHYTDGWFVEANPNGDLLNKATGRNLYALYWEGKETNLNPNPTEGFVVAGKDTISFLEEKLAKLGLTEREADEFIIYWLPKLEDEKYNFIRFQTKAEQDTNMPLLIEPKPDTVIRVMMEYDDLDEPIKVQEQILPPTPVRTGFTVVEWGGTELDVD